MFIPARQIPGEPVTALYRNQVTEVLRSQQMVSSPDILWTRTASGVSGRIINKPRPLPPPKAACPWDPKIRTVVDEESTTKFLYFTFGHSNNLMPTLPVGIFDPAAGIEIAGEGTEYAVLNYTASGGLITGLEVTIETDPPVPPPVTEGAPPAAFTYLLCRLIDGVVDGKGGCCGSFWARIVEAFKTEKETFGPFEVPFLLHYTWFVACGTELLNNCVCDCGDDGGGYY